MQTIKAVQNYTYDDWTNKFVIQFRGEEGRKLCILLVIVNLLLPAYTLKHSFNYNNSLYSI